MVACVHVCCVLTDVTCGHGPSVNPRIRLIPCVIVLLLWYCLPAATSLAMPSPSWRECMVSAGLPQKMADAITVPGCDSQDVFRSAFVDKNAFETWLCKSRDKLGDEASGVDAGDWTTCPLAAKLRLFLSGLQPPTPVGAPAVTPSKESSLALLPFASSQSKVSANERDAAADRKRLSISSENTCFPLPDQLKVFVGLLQLEARAGEVV